MDAAHKSVLLGEVVSAADCLLNADVPQKVWDGTTGLGGHLLALSSRYPTARFFASDADSEMLLLAKERLQDHGVELFHHANFSEKVFESEAPFGFIFLDLGISSLHFDKFERGFSFRYDEPLDMRMDATKGVTAAELLQTASEENLVRIFFDYSQEKMARRIAREIVQRRKSDPVTTTFELAEICKRAYPPKYKAKGHAERHPATRVFQALRIAVNDELKNLEEAMRSLPLLLGRGGRLAVITFHSLEDRIVKHAFRSLAWIKDDDPFAKSHLKKGGFTLLAPGGITPSKEEIEVNPRARSARLRIIERC